LKSKNLYDIDQDPKSLLRTNTLACLARALTTDKKSFMELASGLSGVPDYKLTLWDWTKKVKLHSISTGIKVNN
jgi:hypothetical protein